MWPGPQSTVGMFALWNSDASLPNETLPQVYCDAHKVARVIVNLVVNAIKFCGKEPPQIRISAERSGSDWKISVRDNGIGISQEHADRIFVIFQRLHTKTEYPGTGIGLAICKKIVERHGGRIFVESEPGHGSTFTFTMPDKEVDP